MRITVLIILLLCSMVVRAQWDIGGGLQINFPLMYNKDVGSYNHSLGAFGPQLTAKYYPANSTFYPSVSAHVTGIRLPLVKQGNTVVGMLFRQINFVVSANLVKKFQYDRELHYGLGIGVSYLDALGIDISGSDQGNLLSVDVDASNHITRWVPAVSPHIEFVFPISQEKPLYVGIGGQVQYIYFFDDGSAYTVQVVDQQYQPLKLKAALRGHMVNPGVQLSVYYRFKGRDGY